MQWAVFGVDAVRRRAPPYAGVRRRPLWSIYTSCRFVAFLVERGCSQAYVRSHITVAMYVLDFLRATIATPDESPRVAALIGELQRVHRQVLCWAPPPSAAVRHRPSASPAVWRRTPNPPNHVSLQVLWVAAAPKPRDVTALEQSNAWMDYDELLKCSLRLLE